jgi:hypothetical protein
MVLYKCPRCEYESNKKIDIRRHYIRKRPCVITHKNISQEDCLKFLQDPSLEISEIGYLKEQVEKQQQKQLNEQITALINTNKEQLEINTQLLSRISKLEKLQPKNEIDTNLNQFIYILKEREFVKSDEEIYKIGKTRSLTNRIGDYPKGSKIKLIYPCEDMNTIEKELLLLFDDKFIRMTDVGREYFRGDINVMVNLVTNHITSKTSEMEVEPEIKI